MSDQLVRAISKDGFVKAAAVSTRALTERARQIHQTSPVATAALGRLLAAGSMMGNELKGDGSSVTLRIKGDGPLGTLLVVADNEGNVRGSVQNPQIDLPIREDGKLDVGGAVGHGGTLTVIKDLNLKEPYVGKSNMVSGEIAEDFAQYFTVSEQQPSMVYLGVRVDPHDGKVRAGGGLIVQPMPFCPDDVIDNIQDRVPMVKMLAGMLDDGIELEASLKKIFDGIDMTFTETMETGFRCDCTRERLERVLISLGREELNDMIEKEHGAELTCHFCNKKYSFSEAELKGLLEEAGKAQ